MQITDFTIRKTAFFISLAGIALLIVFSMVFSPKETTVKSISEESIEKGVIVKGIVQKVFFTKNTLLFEIADPEKIRAVKFSPTKKELETIKENNFVELEGTVKKYNGELEIVAKNVKKID